MATRIIRRITRAPLAEALKPSVAAQARKEIEALLDHHLQAIAKNNAQIETLAKANEDRHAAIEKLLKDAKMHGYTNGVLEAAFKDKFSNEKKEVDAKALYEHLKKHKKLPAFFECVKAQIGALSKHLSELEIKALAKVTPAQKTGTELVITPVKTVVEQRPKTRGKK